MITNRQRNFMIIVSSQALFLGLGYSIIFNSTNNNSWICSLLGSLLGLIFTFMLNRFLKYKKDKNLISILDNSSIIGILTRFLLIILSIVIINIVLFITKEFIKSYLLIHMPSFLIILPLMILALYVSNKGYSLISYISECLVPIALTLMLFALITLIFKANYTNLKPFFSSSNTSMIKSVFFYFILSTSPLLLLIDMNFEENNISNAYLSAFIIITITSVLISGILGQFLTKIYRFLEYMILKDIHIFNFIEKIENLLSISWIINAFLLLCIACCFLKKILPKKYNNFTHLSIILIIFIVVCTVLSSSYLEVLYSYIPYTLAFISIPTILILFCYSFKK